MAAGDMSLEDLDKYIKGFQQMGKWGWLPEMRMALKYCRNNAKARVKEGKQVNGNPYPKLAIPKQASLGVGDVGPVGVWGKSSKTSAKQIAKMITTGKGNAIYAKLYSANQAMKANTVLGYVAMQKKKWIQKAKPIYRPVWKIKKKMSGPGSLYKALSEPSSNMGLHIAGRSFMHYGFKAYMWRHAGKHQFGWRGKKGEIVPIRELLGATPKDVDYLEAIMMNGVVNREAKLAAKQKAD